MCNEYNGWSNRQSWAVGLWIDNDEGLYNTACQLVDSAREDVEDCPHRYWTDEEYIKFTVADQLQATIEELNPLADDANLYSDLLSHALALVDWQEVARHYIEEE